MIERGTPTWRVDHPFTGLPAIPLQMPPPPPLPLSETPPPSPLPTPHLPSPLSGLTPFLEAIGNASRRYGVDAYDSKAWYDQAGSYYPAEYPHLTQQSNGGAYVLREEYGAVSGAEDEDAQADWLSTLATEIEAKFVGCGQVSPTPSSATPCEQPAATRILSGGVVQSFRDEWWRGSVDANQVWFGSEAAHCDDDQLCTAMRQLCPPMKAGISTNQSICGANFDFLQPDGYVNQEWFGIVAAVPSCTCARSYGANQSACTASDYALRARKAFYALQSLWTQSSALRRADADTLLTPAIGADGEDPLNCTTPPELHPCLGTPRMQRYPGSLALTLDCEPFLMRGVAYSPAPLGDDPGYSEPWGDYFTEEYLQLFSRDFALLASAGVNTLRLYSFKTSVRHKHFLDMAHAQKINVMVSARLAHAHAHRTEGCESAPPRLPAPTPHYRCPTGGI